MTVYGSGYYSEDSVICRSVMHSGLYQRFGNIIYSNFKLLNYTVTQFEGNFQNNVESKPKKEDNPVKAYGVGHFEEECPMDKVKKISLSKYFIQNNENIETKDAEDEISNILNTRKNKSRNKKHYNNKDIDRFIKN